MNFNSIDFLWIFLPVTVAGYCLLSQFKGKHSITIKNIFLFFASFFFYAWGSIPSIPFFLASIAIAW